VGKPRIADCEGLYQFLNTRYGNMENIKAVSHIPTSQQQYKYKFLSLLFEEADCAGQYRLTLYSGVLKYGKHKSRFPHFNISTIKKSIGSHLSP
jgi:hypothetical protein